MTTPAPPAAEPKARLPRWMRIGLLASVALNVMLLGVIGGGLWRLRDAAATTSIGPNMLAYSATLPSDRRDAVRKLFQDKRATVRPLRMAAQQARRELRAAMLAEPFDKPKLVAAHDRLIAAETRMRQEVGAVVADAAEKLSADERREFMRRAGGGRRGPGRGGPSMFGDDGDAEGGGQGRPKRP